MEGFNPLQYVGLAGVTVVESFVQYLKDQWNLPGKFAPLAAVAFAVILNILLALYMGTPLGTGALVGFFTGFLSSAWHEVVAKRKADEQLASQVTKLLLK